MTGSFSSQQSGLTTLQTLFDVCQKLSIGAIVIDISNTILFVNDSFTRETNYCLSAPLSSGGAVLHHVDGQEHDDHLLFQMPLLNGLIRRESIVSLVNGWGHSYQASLHYSDLEDGNCLVTMTDVSNAVVESSKTLKALYEISNAISVTKDLSELYPAIHAILHKHVDATNFLLGLIEEENDRIFFPYFADEVDDYYDLPNISDPATNTMTTQVIRSGSPLFLRFSDVQEKKEKQESFRVVGTDPAVWLGVPLSCGGKIIGVMTVQHYSNPLHYGQEDVAFMTAVSEQVAVAIERKKAEEALSRLNERLESIVAERTSELEKKAHELEKANERLKELDQVKSALLSSVSHELRTPLTSIMGFTKLVKKDFRKYSNDASASASKDVLGSRIISNLDIVSQESKRLRRLISEFLDLAKIESGHMLWNDQSICPITALKEAGGAVQGLFGTSLRVQLKIEAPLTLPSIHVDPDKLRQVLMNLLTNAAKFTRQGEVRLCVSQRGDMIVFSVRDTGIGIPEDMLANVFEKFFKVEESSTVGEPGTGLGLAICKQIVEHYGGSINVTSILGSGSEFTFTLPVELAQQSENRVSW